MAWPGGAWRGMAGLGLAGPSESRRGSATQDKVPSFGRIGRAADLLRRGEAGLGMALPGGAWPGVARPGTAWQDKVAPSG